MPIGDPHWADELLHVIRKLGAKPKSVMLFGHNRGLTELAHHLSNKPLCLTS